MKGTEPPSQELMSLLQARGVGIRKLLIESPEHGAFNQTYLMQLLKTMPRLKSLRICGLKRFAEVDGDGELQNQQLQQQQQQLPILKSLNLFNTTALILSLIGCSITSMRICITEVILPAPVILRRFLRSQEHLKELHINISREDIRLQLFSEAIDENTFTFKLQKLLLTIVEHHPAASVRNLRHFIFAQRGTLRCLRIFHLDGNVYRVISDLDGLDQLYIQSLPQPMNFGNRHVSEVTINLRGTSPSHDALALLRVIRSVRKLTFINYFINDNRDFVGHVSETLPELTHLKINDLTAKAFSCVSFPKLISLTAVRVFEGVNWGRFARDSPNITNILMENWEGSGSSLLSMFSAFKNLTKFVIEDSEIKYDDDFLLEITKKCKSLREGWLSRDNFATDFDFTASHQISPWLKYVSF